MYTDNYEYEIDLKGLFFAVLHKWRLLLISAVLAAVVLGGYEFLTADAAVDASAAEESTEDLEQYARKKEAFEATSAKLMADIEESEKYISESPMMQIDPYKETESTAELLVEIADVKSTDLSNLLRAYEYALADGSYTEGLAEQLDIEQKYVKELIQIRGVIGLDNSSETRMVLQTPEEADSKGILRLRTIGNDAEVTEKILDAVVREAEKLNKEFGASMGGHRVSMLRQSTSQKVDKSLADTQQTVRDNMAAMQRSLVEADNNLKNLTEPEDAVSSSESSVLKNIILGFLMGGFLAICIVCAWYIMGDKVTSSKEVAARYRLKMLGTFSETHEKRPFDFVDKWIRRLAGERSARPDDEVLEMIAANVGNYSEGENSLFITGFASRRRLEQVSEYLTKVLPNKKFVVAGDIVMNAASRKKLAECEAIILVEERARSRYSLIQQELELAGNVGKEVIGVVVG